MPVGTTTTSISFSNSGVAPTTYTIDYDAGAEAASFADVTSATSLTDADFVIPANTPTGIYEGILTYIFADGCTGMDAFTIIVVPADDTGTDDQTLTEVLTSGNSAGSSSIDMNNNKINNLVDPMADQDAATKKYVDDSNLQSDWTQTTTTANDYIKNKPTIAATITDAATNSVESNAIFDALALKQNAASALQLGSTSTTALAGNTTTISTAQSTKLDGIAEGAEVNVNPDWDATSGDAQILNKPTLAPSTAEQNVQSDWTQTNTQADDFIKNKPNIGTGGEENVQSNWTQTTTTEDDYIKNKPTTITAAQGTAITANTAKVGITSAQASAITTNTAKITYPSADATKLAGIDAGAEVNAQPDWNQTTTTADDYIKNKPNIGTGGEENIQSDWNQTTTSADDFIENKPTTITAAQGTAITANTAKVGITSAQASAITTNTAKNTYPSADATKLAGIDTGAEVNEQSDWNQTTTSADDFIENKPTTISTVQASAITANTAKNTYPSADATKLAGIDTGAEVNEQSDWNQTTTSADDYIENKPTTITAAQGTAITANTAKVGITSAQATAITTNTAKTTYPSADATKLSGIDAGAEVNEQSDWNQTTTSADDFIENKPTTISTVQASAITANTAKNTYPSADATKLAGIDTGAEVNEQSDWNQTTTSADDYIENKPTTISTVQASAITANTAKNTYPSADATKLAGIDTGAEVNEQSDWNQTTTSADDFIENKPTTITAAQGTAITANAAKVGITSAQATAITTNTAKTTYPSADATKLAGIDTGAEVNEQSDWNQTTTSADDYIENKSTTISTVQASAITANTAKNTYPSADATKLAGIDTGAEVNEQS